MAESYVHKGYIEPIPVSFQDVHSGEVKIFAWEFENPPRNLKLEEELCFMKYTTRFNNRSWEQISWIGDANIGLSSYEDALEIYPKELTFVSIL